MNVAELVPGELLQHRYQVMRLIDQGGTAAVYEAVDRLTGDTVALKQFPADETTPTQRICDSEASVLAIVSHPALPKRLDYFDSGSSRYLVMEYVEGDDLAQLLACRGEPFPEGQVLEWALQVLDALNYLHRLQPPVVHCDVKPANLVLTSRSRVMLLDFGLAARAPAQAVTVEPRPGYTVSYAPPEQLHNLPVDARSDIYALGATLYELLTGVKPLDALRRETAIEAGQPDPLPPAHEIQPGVSSAAAAVLRKALALRADRRWANAAAMRLALQTVRDEPATSSAPAAPQHPTPRHNLPTVPNPLIGRERELEHAARFLRNDETRLLTLTGPGGIGKTRLALTLAGKVLLHFTDGVFWVPLAHVSQPELVLPAVAHSLEVIESAERTLIEAVQRRIGDGGVLLLLDNFEHLLPAGVHLDALLQACPRLKLLVTSRERLRLAWEQELPVSPLAVPAHAGARIETIRAAPAVQFFIERASRVLPDFALDESNATAVAAVCTRLDGLPLAIELAAGRSKVLSPAAMLARLDARHAWLRTTGSELPARHHTLAAAIEWSYDLLSCAEQGLFRWLAVFAAPAALDACEAVAGLSDPILSSGAIDGLESLLDKNLLRRTLGVDGEPRFGMLESIRAYALLRLAQDPDAPGVWERHASYFMALADQAEAHLRGADQQLWLERLEEDRANLTAVLAHLLAANRAEDALRLAGALWRFWWTRGRLTEGLNWLTRCLIASEAGASGQLAPQAEHGDWVQWRMKALHGASALARDLGRYDEAQHWCETGLALAERSGGSLDVANAFNSLGSLAIYRENYDAARPWLEKSLALRRRADDALGLAGSLNNLGLVLMQGGDYTAAEDHYRESLLLYRRQNDGWGEALALGNLALARFKQGDGTAAREFYEASLVRFGQLGDDEGVMTVVEGIAWLALAQGQLREAASLIAAAERGRRQLGTALYGADLRDHEATVATLRKRLNPLRFLACWQQGEALSQAELVALATEVLRRAQDQ